MSKLHELIAVEPDLKAEAVRRLGEAQALFTNGTVRLLGLLRRYRPLEEDGEPQTDETTELAVTVTDELTAVRETFGRYLDVTLQKEITNGATSADVVVDGKVVLPALPAPALLNIEARLAQLRALYAAIPTNDPSERWEYDEQQGVYVSAPRVSYRTRKVPKALVGAPATEQHPAQVQYYQEDVRE